MKQAVIQKAEEKPKQRGPNLTGIPTQMKLDFEQRSGLSFDDVRVHYNSDKPRRIGALAYTQIPQVHIGPGQERHLRHELGHVVQQKSGGVVPTKKVSGLPLNDDPKLEVMADKISVFHKITDSRNCLVIQMAPDLGTVATTRCDLFSSRLSPGGIVQVVNTCRILDENRSAANGNAFTANENRFVAMVEPQLLNELSKLNFPNNHLMAIGNIIMSGLLYVYKRGVRFNIDIVRNAIRNGIEDYYKPMTATIIGNNQNNYSLADPNTSVSTKYLLHLLSKVLLSEYYEKYIISAGPFLPYHPWDRKSQLEYTNRDSIKKVVLKEHKSTMPTLGDINEAVIRTNRLIKLDLPDVKIKSTSFGGTTTFPDFIDDEGKLRFGLGTGMSQVMHELGHHIENHLDIHSFVLLFRFMLSRTDPNLQERKSGAANFDEQQKSIIEGPTGGVGLNTGHSYFSVKQNRVIFEPPFTSKQTEEKNLHENSVAQFMLRQAKNGVKYLLLKPVLGHRRAQSVAIDADFRETSISPGLSYDTHYKKKGYFTEFISTTIEMLSTSQGAKSIIKSDPKRVAFFIYLTNRAIFNRIDGHFQAAQRIPPPQFLLPQNQPVTSLFIFLNLI